MKELKVGKNVTLTLDNVLAVEQMMTKTKINFSRTLNYILSDWIKIRHSLAAAGKAKRDELKVSERIDDIKKAKGIKE
jgi:BioD-like phosphotransacetylase family protein